MRPRPPEEPRRRPGATEPTGSDRFRSLDEYRVRREWDRYQGNGLRDLFRELRVRFLARHPAPEGGRVLEVGPGPGRFSPHLAGPGRERVLVDLAPKALEAARTHLSGFPAELYGRSEFVRAEGCGLPFTPGAFSEAVLLGNILGFAGARSELLMEEAVRVLRPGGSLLLEAVAGPGTRSRYLHRLPPGVVRRTLAAPVRAVAPRVEREGVEVLSREAKPGHSFRRWDPEELARWLRRRGLILREAIAVAPLLGDAPERAEAVRVDPKSWSNLLDLEEEFGHRAPLVGAAAAYLVAAQRAASGTDGAMG